MVVGESSTRGLGVDPSRPRWLGKWAVDVLRMISEKEGLTLPRVVVGVLLAYRSSNRCSCSPDMDVAASSLVMVLAACKLLLLLVGRTRRRGSLTAGVGGAAQRMTARRRRRTSLGLLRGAS